MNTMASTVENEHEYDEFQQSIHDNFSAYADKKLFTTNAEGLFDLYLKGIPENHRQHYNCHCCKKFIETYGGLVFISPGGSAIPVLWSRNNTPEFFDRSTELLYVAVSKAKVTGVFFDKKEVWGTPVTGPWHHLHVKPAKENVFYSRLQTPFQASAEKKEDFKNVIRALKDFPLEAVNQAVNLLNQDALYRSEKILGQAQWLKELHDSINTHKKYKANLIWSAVASAPAGFCHPRSSMIGTLLEDIVAGLPFEAINRRFSEKMGPLQYQRPQAAPSIGNIAEAEKIVQKLGIAKSLERRFARIDEIETLWKPVEKVEEANGGGLFGHLDVKNSKKIKPVYAPAKTMTWEKFAMDVLPGADDIEFIIPRSKTSYAAILTAVHDDAPPILQWDRDHKRNPFSWYLYHNGSHANKWGIMGYGPHKVTAICYQPSMWGDASNTHQGVGVMFVLDGAKDIRGKNEGNGLFSEIMKAELRVIRSTIEAYSRNADLSGQSEASACGLLLQKGNKWNAEFRVTSDGVTNSYLLDRWE